MNTTIYEILVLLRWLLPRQNYLQIRGQLQKWVLNEREQFFYINNPVTLQSLELHAFLTAEILKNDKSPCLKMITAKRMLRETIILPQVIISKHKNELRFITSYNVPGKILREIYVSFFRTRLWSREYNYLANTEQDMEASAQAVYILKRMNATPVEAINILLELDIIIKIKNTYKDEQD